MAIDRDELREAIRAAMAELERESERPARAAPAAADCADGVCKPRPRPRVPVFDPRDLEAVRSASPARLAQGRTGTRYLTEAYVGLRAEHAIALDAVQSEVSEGLPAQLGCIALKSRCSSREEFLLMPDLGRRLDEASAAKLEKEGTRNVDVQIICGDGLSAWAIEENGPRLLPALKGALESKGLKVGQPLFVRFARVGIQDDIGVRTGARATGDPGGRAARARHRRFRSPSTPHTVRASGRTTPRRTASPISARSGCPRKRRRASAPRSWPGASRPAAAA